MNDLTHQYYFKNGGTLSKREAIEYFNLLADANGVEQHLSTMANTKSILKFARENFDADITVDIDDKTFHLKGDSPEPAVLKFGD